MIQVKNLKVSLDFCLSFDPPINRALDSLSKMYHDFIPLPLSPSPP